VNVALDDLDAAFPKWIGEVPDFSCVWIGYTATKYFKSGGARYESNWVLCTNITFAVVLGTVAS